jgi:hypothetical protein
MSQHLFSQQEGNASAPNHNTLISEFIDSLDYKKFIELKEYIKSVSPDVGSGGAMPFGTPPRPLMQRVDITVPKLNELGQYIQSLLQKKGTRGRGGGGGASAAAGGEPVAPKFNPQEIELLRKYIQEKQEKEQQLFAATLSGRKSPSGARNNLAGGDNSPSFLKALALGGRGSPVPIGRASPAPIGGGSPVPLGRASPLPIGRASPKPRHFPRRSRKNSTFRK